jgi:prepilin-type N-terminal cleavage/methylation domain-containing protein
VTLIETMLALSILGVVLMGLGGLMFQAARHTRQSAAVAYRSSAVTTAEAWSRALPWDSAPTAIGCVDSLTAGQLLYTRCVELPVNTPRYQQIRVIISPIGSLVARYGHHRPESRALTVTLQRQLTRRGFTLTELLIGTIVLAILGTVLARLLVNDSRFVSRQDAMMSARQASRAALNTMVDELRMVSDGGLIAVSTDSVRVRMPYVFGMACNSVSGDLISSLTPPDSLMYANASPDGLARRSGTSYVFLSGISLTPSSDMAACSSDSIRVVPGGSLVEIGGISPPQMPSPGTLIYLFQNVTYRFGASTDLPGRIGLWRRAGSSPDEELVTPFDTLAGFQCLVGPNLQALDCPPPGGLSAVRGLELRLVGASEYTPRGDSGPQTFNLATRVTFLNKVN